jgi:acyl-CoA synthetase (AMP-forming)/AMP-acid ligase II
LIVPTLFDAVAHYADDQYPEKLAILTETDGTRTYGELADRSARLGCAFHDRLGIEPGQRISIWMHQRPEWIETSLAAAASGISNVAANPQWTDAEYEYVLRHSGSRLIVCDEERAERALALRRRLDQLRHVVVVDPEVPDDAHAIEQLIGEAPDDARTRLPRVPDTQEGGLSYTSGTTTGRPKAVVVGRASPAESFDFREMFGINDRDRGISITPFFHGNGLSNVQFALAYGASCVFPRTFSARRFWGLVDRYRPTYMITLIALMNIVMSLPPSDLDRSHSFRVLVVLGAGPNMAAIEERYGTPVIDWYGMTEGGMGTYTRLNEPRRPGSAGRPFPGSDMHILREDGTEAAPGEVGEVVFNTEVTGFKGYLDDEEATGAVLDGKWFRTGDMGYFDDDGYFYFRDRKKDIVRRGGENISSLEVESFIRSHPSVADVAVVGKPDPVLGERLVAFIQPHVAGEAPTVENLRTFAEGGLARFKVPEEVIETDALPRTGTGKVEKFRLRQIAASRQGAPEKT